MSFWWMDPGWKQTLCSKCNINIWESGGDPDHGVCYECFMEAHPRKQPEPTVEEMCGPEHLYYANDAHGPRCYCGKVTQFSNIRPMEK